MRKLIAGNWKMNGLAASLAEIVALKGLTGEATCDIVVCPPFTLIERAAREIVGTPLAIGAQDCHPEPAGAYTGDIAAQMLADAGCRHVIVGHSERRTVYGESDALIARKARAVHEAGLNAIICVGETQAERGSNEALQVVAKQIAGSVPDGALAANTTIAYEPVWAIGTGRVPTLEQIGEVHSAIRNQLQKRFGSEGTNIRILYGGSVKGSNAVPIFAIPDVNGALVGGASLRASDLAEIVAAAL
jgi:triosephosphate isomerase